MKKILSVIGLSLGLFASEVQFGQGNMKIDSNILGLNLSKNEKVIAYSLVNEHKNIFSSKYFYSYKLAYYKSNTIKTAYKLNAALAAALGVPQNILIYNKLRGIDLNIVLGRDFINENKKDTYLGTGLLIGASFPYLKTNSNNNNNNSSLKYLKKSKTKFYTYKIGLSVKGEKALNGFINIYANTAYAFQTAKVKNSELKLDSSSNGDYFTFNTGVKFQAKTKKKIGFVTLSPALFATLGYRYDYWKVKDVKYSTPLKSGTQSTDIDLKVSQFYVGLGYDF